MCAILPAPDLLARHRARVAEIEELAGTTRPHFERYHLALMLRLAAWAQDFPCARPGQGAILGRGLGACAAALRLCRGRLLPPGAPPEDAALRQAAWSYAVFTILAIRAARDVFALDVAVAGEGGVSGPWNPWAGPAGSGGARWYRAAARPGSGRGGWRRRAGALLAPGLVGAEGIAWLESDPALFELWLACVCGDEAGAGILGEIADEAENGFSARREEAAPAPAPGPAPELPVPGEAGASPPAPSQPGVEEAGGGVAAAVPPGAREPPGSGRRGGRFGGAAQAAPPVATLGREFLAWLVEGVAAGRIPCNGANARVHGVPEGVLLASPAIFQDYASAAGLEGFEAVQRSFLRLKMHRLTAAKSNMHGYALRGKGVSVNGLLLPDPKALFGEASPALNPLLERL